MSMDFWVETFSKLADSNNLPQPVIIKRCLPVPYYDGGMVDSYYDDGVNIFSASLNTKPQIWYRASQVVIELGWSNTTRAMTEFSGYRQSIRLAGRRACLWLSYSAVCSAISRSPKLMQNEDLFNFYWTVMQKGYEQLPDINLDNPI